MKNIKLQYYLRGLGVGVLLTALILGFVLSKETKPLTDAQIRERALELGMVDSNSLVLSDLQGDEFVKVEATDENGEDDSVKESIAVNEAAGTEEAINIEETTEADETASVEEAADIEETADIVEQPNEEVQESVEQSVAEETTQTRVNGTINAEGDTVTIEIRAGANSYTVSKILADNGLVADAWAYDRYLCDNGYSKRIHTGKYLIAIGTSEEEIAQIITGNR